MNLTYKGIPVFYNDEGKGKVLVFLHGFLENSTMWNFITKTLKTHYRCISIDLLGHGQTGMLADVHTMEMMAEAVNAVFEQLEIEKLKLIGHSMGGYVALAFTEKYPMKVEGLCLMNSTALNDSAERKKIRERAVEVIRSDKRIFISMAISNLFAPNNLLIYNEEINNLKEEAYKLSVKGINAAIMGMQLRPNRVNVFANCNCKKLVILGNEDSILDLQEQKSYLIPLNIEIKVLEGGHMLQIENKYEITYIIKRFSE